MRTRRPFVIVLGVAALSCALLGLAIALSWLGPDVGRGANFCEAARDALFKQPANTLSNLGFVLAGLAAAWYAGRASPDSVMPRAVQTWFACIVVLLGPGSAAMHATQSDLGGRLDLLSMYLLAAFAVAWPLARLLGLGPGRLAVVWVVLVAACETAARRGDAVPLLLHAGNAAFGALLVLALVLEAVWWRRVDHRGDVRRDVRFGLGAVGTLLVAFGIWAAAQRGWCDPHSWVQGHAAWHVLCAGAAYLLFRLYASERRAAPDVTVG